MRLFMLSNVEAQPRPKAVGCSDGLAECCERGKNWNSDADERHARELSCETACCDRELRQGANEPRPRKAPR